MHETNGRVKMTPQVVMWVAAALIAYGVHLGTLLAISHDIAEMKHYQAELVTREVFISRQADEQREFDRIWSAIRSHR